MRSSYAVLNTPKSILLFFFCVMLILIHQCLFLVRKDTGDKSIEKHDDNYIGKYYQVNN